MTIWHIALGCVIGICSFVVACILAFIVFAHIFLRKFNS